MQTPEKLSLLKELGELIKARQVASMAIDITRINAKIEKLLLLLKEPVDSGIKPQIGLFQKYLVESKGDHIEAAKQLYKKEFQGKYVNTVLGKVVFSQSGFGKISGGFKLDPLKTALIESIPEILSTGDYHGYKELSKERKDNFVRFHFFTKVVGAGSRYILAGVTVAEKTDGSMFYNINHDESDAWAGNGKWKEYLYDSVGEFDGINLVILKVSEKSIAGEV